MPTSCLDMQPSVLSRLNLIAGKSYTLGSKTVVFRGFQSSKMSKPLMENSGEDSLTLLPADSLVRTSASPETEVESKASEADSGKKCYEWFQKFDRDTSSWKTRQPSLFEDLESSWETWPRWGMMQSGECFPLPTLEHDTSAQGYGVLPTPIKQDMRFATYKKSSFDRNHSIASLSEFFARRGRRITPCTCETLMRWPYGWTDLQQSAMGSVRQWLNSHGKL